MAYSTQAEIEKKVPTDELLQLTDLEDAGAINTTVLDEAIEAADAEIDSFLRVRGETVPLTDVPTIVEHLSVALAIGELYSNRGSADEVVTKRVEWARKWLTEFAAGHVSLGDANHTDSDPASAGGVESEAAKRVFTRDDMGGW